MAAPLFGCAAAPVAEKPKKPTFPPLRSFKHLDPAFDIVESPPGDALQARDALFAAQGRTLGRTFYPKWAQPRVDRVSKAAWAGFGRRWDTLRPALYKLDNGVMGQIRKAGRRFGETMGRLPPADVHVYFVPDPRAGASSFVDGQMVIGLNAAALAEAGPGAVEREVLRQLAILEAKRTGGLPSPPTLAAGLYLEGVGARAIRAVLPKAPESEAVGATPAGFQAASSKIRDVDSRIRAGLDASDPATTDALLVDGAGDPLAPLAARISALSLVRTMVDEKKAATEVLSLDFARFRERATGFWKASAAPVGGALVVEKSAAEEKAIARGGRTAEDCIGDYTEEGPAHTLTFGGTSWTRKGGRLDASLGGGSVTLGLIADIKRADDDTLKNLESFVTQYRAAGIKALLIAGDTSETAAGIQDALGVLAKLDVPILIIPGNRESQGRYRQAMRVVTKAHENVIDGTRTRLVDTNRFSVVTLPGYYDPKYVHAKDGCLYDASHLEDLKAIAAKAGGRPRILLTHGPPRAAGKTAIDFADAGANVGDPALSALLAGGLFQVGVYANLHETGGRAARGNLKTSVKPGSWVPDIHLITGSANAMPWDMLDGSTSEGMAGLLDIKGSKVRYRVIKP
jgi:hypothetical protein